MKRFLVFYLFIFFSCTNTFIHEHEQFILKETDKTLKYKLDEETVYMFFNLFPFYQDGKEYLTFRNYKQNEILFYDLKKGDFLFKLDFPREGDNSIISLMGYHIEDLNNIYLLSIGIDAIIKTDTSTKIIKTIPFGNTAEGHQITESYSMNSHPYTPLIIQDHKFYLTQLPFLSPVLKTPVTVFIDTLENTYGQLPFIFPGFIKDSQMRTHSSCLYSREFNGKEFIYSFFHDEDIYVTSLDSSEKEVRIIKGKSKYIDKIPLLKTSGQELQTIARKDLEIPRYGNLIYDKYRNVYYRFVYHEVELDTKINWYLRSFFGRKKFSIIIFDEDFNVIGETLFPESIYNSYVYFVHEDGLYISDNYQINYDQPEDVLSFVCFELVKN